MVNLNEEENKRQRIITRGTLDWVTGKQGF